MVALELGDTCVELLEDEDLENPGALGDRLERAVSDRHHRQVVLDLSRLRRITSAVFAVLVGAEERGATRGTPVAFACARLGVRRALAGLRRLLTIHGSVGRALEAICEAGCCARRGDVPEEDHRKERAMDDERIDGVVPEGPGPQEEEEQKEEHEEKPEAEAAVPPRELPASVMRHLEEEAPELAGALPQMDELMDEPPEEIPEAEEPPAPEIPAPDTVDVLPEAPPEEAPVEVPAEPPAAPKKVTRRKHSGGRKAKGQGRKRGKPAKGRSKGGKKARA